jgi:hypothetical protein
MSLEMIMEELGQTLLGLLGGAAAAVLLTALLRVVAV